jgi:hypothetical protein
MVNGADDVYVERNGRIATFNRTRALRRFSYGGRYRRNPPTCSGWTTSETPEAAAAR